MQDIDLLQTNYQYLELYHVQTKTSLQLPLDSTAVNIGKYNNEISPDIDVSNLPNADIVSRTHAVSSLFLSSVLSIMFDSLPSLISIKRN